MQVALWAQTTKIGDIDGETWTSDESPYIITGDIKVIDLTIEPGVLIQFDDNHKFEVEGVLRAEGFHSDSIYFQPQPGNIAGWEGIKFKINAVSSSLKYCRIEGATKEGINIDQAQPEISNCRIVENDESGIFIKRTTIQLQHCIISNNTLNGIETEEAQLTLVNSIISDNEVSGILSTHANDIFNLTNVVIADNQNRGVDCPNGILTIRNSIIYYNSVQIDSQDGNTDVTYSDVQGATEFPGEGNRNFNPDFLERRYYTLSSQSPCIDAGDQNFAFSDRFFPPSMGTFLNDMGAYGGPQAFGWYPPLYIKPQSFDFNRVTQDSSQSTELNILNYRDIGITVSEILFEDDDDQVFSQDPDSFFVAISDSVDLVVNFKPEDERIYNTDLVLETQSHGTVSLSVTGEGVLAHIELLQSKLDFDHVPVGENLTLTVPVQNTGGDTLHLVLIQPVNDVFQIEQTALKINPDFASDTIRVSFIPDSVKTFQDSLIILSNDRDNPRIVIPLSGEGFSPVINIDPPNLNFGSIAVLSDTLLHLTIRNIGNNSLDIDSLILNQPDSIKEAFSISVMPEKFPIELDPDSSINISVRFAPKDWGLISGQLLVYSSDPIQDVLSVRLHGTGLASEIAVSSTELDFGQVLIISDSTQILTVENIGNFKLVIEEFEISSSDSVFVMSDTTISFPFDIEPASSADFPIEFTPADTGLSEDQILITSNDPYNTDVAVSLSGRGTSSGLYPLIELSSDVLEFNEVDTSSFSQKALYIYNKGDVDLFIPQDSIYITSSAYDAFSIVNLTNDITIVPQDSQEVLIRFETPELGPDQANLWIKSNDPLNPTMIVLLSGIGVGNGSSTISFDPANSTDPLINRQPATLSFEITSFLPIDSATIFIRRGGETSFTSVPLQNQGITSVWSAEIDSNLITERGVEYYVLVNQSHTFSVYPQNGESHPIAVSVQIPYLAFPDDIPAKTYQMISIPFSTPDQNLSDLFLDNLGTYNDSNYRIFECTNGSDYSEMKEMNKPLPPGESVWLITREPVGLDIQNGESVITDEEYTIELRQGWNMIATPFAFPVSWDNLGAGLALRHYDGSDWPFASFMEPYKGYAVKALQDTVITLSANEVAIPKSLPKSISPNLADNWNIQISALSDHLNDQFNYVGVLNSAANGRDRYDYPEPPPIGDYLSLYLVSSENEEHLSTDYRQPGAEGYIFDIKMRSNIRGKKNIQLDPENLPENYDWMVVALETKVNLGKKPIQTSLNQVSYKLIVGTSEFINECISEYLSVPKEYKLAQNYPNPFNPITKINYQLPISSKVDLSIYNILGQKVITLVSGKQEPGYYEIEWTGLNQSNQIVSSGIYFLHLKSKDFNQTIKMILQR